MSILWLILPLFLLLVRQQWIDVVIPTDSSVGSSAADADGTQHQLHIEWTNSSSWSSYRVVVVDKMDHKSKTSSIQKKTVVFSETSPIAVYVHGHWCVAPHHHSPHQDDTTTRSLTFINVTNTKHPKQKNNTDSSSAGENQHQRLMQRSFGPFTEKTIHWECSVPISSKEATVDEAGEESHATTEIVVPIMTSFLTFPTSGAVAFQLGWPEGVAAVEANSASTSTTPQLEKDDQWYNKALTNFPCFPFHSIYLPNVLSWQGSFVQSTRSKNTHHSYGPQGGPTLWYHATESLSPSEQQKRRLTIVGSPFSPATIASSTERSSSSSWKTYTSGTGMDYTDHHPAYCPGTSARLKSIPPHFQQTYVLFPSHGINKAMTGWGVRMQQVVNETSPNPPEESPILSSSVTTTMASSSRHLTTSGQNVATPPSVETNLTPSINPLRLPDVTLTHIGYQTDNGAMYCFCQEVNCSQTLLRTVQTFDDDIGVPLGFLSFQGAGTSSGRGKAAPWCIETWGIDEGGLDPLHYPMSVPEFQHALGLPLQLYAPYFCPSTSYFEHHSSSSHPNWTSVSSDPSLPGCDGFQFHNIQASQSLEFYGWFLDKGSSTAFSKREQKRNLMSSFETDFMNQNSNCVPDFVEDVLEGADVWLQGMATAAYHRQIPIQWCYATPTDALAALGLPAVTNMRVSFDFCYGRSWEIGESSLLVAALGLAPSKDTLWTTTNNHTATPGCQWTPDHEQAAVELHLLLALLSTGPVGISDAVGMSNRTMILRAVRQDGTLLKPSRPITAIDGMFARESPTTEPLRSRSTTRRSLDSDTDGFVYGTSMLGPAWLFVSFLLPEAYGVTAPSFWPILSDRSLPTAYRTMDTCKEEGCYARSCIDGDDAVASGCVDVVLMASARSTHLIFEAPAVPASDDASHPPGSEYSPTLTAVWQACADSGWILLGELDKYVPLSPGRFDSVTCTPDGVKAQLRTGSPRRDETVVLTALQPKKNSADHELWYSRRGRKQTVSSMKYKIVTKRIVFQDSNVVAVRFGTDGIKIEQPTS